MLGVTLGLNGQGVAVQIQMDVLFLEAGQISLEQIVVAFIGDVGLELRQIRVGEEAVIEQPFFHFPHFGERVPDVDGISAIRSQFKHDQFLLNM